MQENQTEIEEEILLSDEQMDFLESRAITTGFVAGLGSGKSLVASLKVLMFKLEYPEISAAYYLPTYPLVRDIAFDKFPKLCVQLGLQYKLNKTDKELLISDNGYDLGKVIFRTMSEPENIIGYEVGYSLIDETDILSIEKMTIAYENITARNREKLPDNKPNIVDVVGTPEGYKWFYKNFKAEPIEGSRLIKASTYSNLHNLPNDYIEKLSRLFPPNRLKAYLNGDFTNLTSGTVYEYFKREQHHIDEEIREHEQLHIGQDFNVGGCVSTINVIRGGIPMQLDEIVSNDTQGIILNIKQRYQNRSIIFYPDASGGNSSTNASKSDIALLREAGFIINAPSQNGRIMDRVNTFNVLLSSNKFKINTHKCPRTTEALEQQVWDKNGVPEKSNEHSGGSKDDFLDAEGYFLVRMFGITMNRTEIYNQKFN